MLFQVLSAKLSRIDAVFWLSLGLGNVTSRAEREVSNIIGYISSMGCVTSRAEREAQPGPSPYSPFGLAL